MESNGTDNTFTILLYAKGRDSPKLASLLATGIDVNKVDIGSGSNALHFLFSEVCLNVECQSEAAKCTELLLHAGININWLNKIGDPPLYLAIKNNWTKSALILATNGADLTIRLKEKREILATYLSYNMPEVLYEVFNQDVRIDGVSDHLLHVDFRNVLQYPNDSNNKLLEDNYKHRRYDETAFLHGICNSSTKHIQVFQHPVLQLFLELKYKKLQPSILASFAWHAMIITLYTFYVYFVYVDICPFSVYNKDNVIDPDTDQCNCNGESSTTTTEEATTMSEEIICKIPLGLKTVSGILTAVWISFLLNEIHIWWVHARRSYFTKQTIPWFTFYALMPITLWPSIGSGEYILKWRYPIAAINIFLIWALCVDQFTKIQRLAIIFEMFGKIVLKAFQLALFFVPLFVGFTIAFYIMDVEELESAFSVITIIGLMLGDLKYQELFEPTKQRESSVVYEIIANVLYLMFILLMSVVFINFILALTISDVKELWDDCVNSKTKNQIQLLYIFDRLRLSSYKLFNKIQTEQRRLEYTLNINHPPSYVSPELIKQLRELAVKKYCRHNAQNYVNNPTNIMHKNNSILVINKENSDPDSKNHYQNLLTRTQSIELNYEDGKIIYEALRLLERKLNIETKL